MIDREELKQALIRDEGQRLRPYKCTAGRTTIGVGRNLDGKGISEAEALRLLDNDITELMEDGRIAVIIEGHDAARAEVVLNMAFNLGAGGLLKFRNMLSAFAARNYQLSAVEMMNSQWAAQVGQRAVRLAEQMRTGRRQ